MLLDYWAGLRLGKPYDKNGAWAATGVVLDISVSYTHLIEETDSVTARPFGLVHGGIGTFDQVFHAQLLVLEQSNANTRRAKMFLSLQMVGQVQALADFFRNQLRIHSRFGRIFA